MWTFLNPAFLWALGAAAIPLVLHLLQRRQSVVVHFSTLRFLKLAQKKSSKRMKMENFLLWLLRTLLLLVLALAFALPVLRSSMGSSLLGRSYRDVAIVWDVSGSMSYVSGPKNVWEESRQVVQGILKDLKQGDRVSIHLAAAEPVPLLAEPTADLDLAGSMVKAQNWRTGVARILPALNAACQSLQNSGRREREVYIVSDGQSLSWRDFAGKSDAAPTNAATWEPARWGRDYTFFAAIVGADSPANAAALDAEVIPHLLMEDTPASLTARLARFGAAGEGSITMQIDGHEVARQAAAADATDVSFALPPLGRGTHAVRIDTANDALMFDNSLHLLVRVRERLPVLVTGPDDGVFFVKRALAPGGEVAGAIDVKVVPPDQVQAGDLSGYAAVVLCDAFPLAGGLLLAVEQYVQNGGLVVLFPGDRGSVADYANAGFLPARPVSLENEDETARSLLRLVSAQDPIFASLKFPSGSVPSANIKRRIAWGALEKDAEVLVMARADAPFLLSRKVGRGRVLAFSVSADRGWSNLPLSPYFLPFLHQMIEFGAGSTRDPLYVWHAKEMRLPDGLPGLAEGATLRGPGNERIPVRQVRGEGETSWWIDDPPGPGIYAQGEGDAPAPVLAVNVRRDESDLSVLPVADIENRLGDADVQVARDSGELARLVERHRVGKPLTEPLLWLAFALAVTELFFSNRAVRRGRSLSQTMVVELSGRVTKSEGA